MAPMIANTAPLEIATTQPSRRSYGHQHPSDEADDVATGIHDAGRSSSALAGNCDGGRPVSSFGDLRAGKTGAQQDYSDVGIVRYGAHHEEGPAQNEADAGQAARTPAKTEACDQAVACKTTERRPIAPMTQSAPISMPASCVPNPLTSTR